MQLDSFLDFDPPPSEETSPSPRKAAKEPALSGPRAEREGSRRETYSDKQMLHDLLEIVLSADFPAKGDLSFKDEIKALRAALSHLQESFTQAESLDEQLKLITAISHLTTCLARLVRTQEFLRKTQPSPMNQALDAAIKDTVAEWGLT